MDRGDREREMVSRAISELFDVLLTHSHVARAFERLLEQSDDLALDVPAAQDILAKFLARAVHDEILPPSFLTDPTVAAVGGSVVQLAVALLSIRQASARLERVWGVSDANASVAELKRELSLLVEEYYVGGDVAGTLSGLKALAVPHLLHEAVKRAILLAIDRSQQQREAAVKLFAAAAVEHVISQEVMCAGFHIVQGRLGDVKLDTPSAPTLFRQLTEACIASKALPTGFVPDGEKCASPAHATEAKE
jgi:programmed cell death protein 4